MKAQLTACVEDEDTGGTVVRPRQFQQFDEDRRAAELYAAYQARNEDRMVERIARRVVELMRETSTAPTDAD